MAALIVSHQGPDLDSCTSTWMVRRYFKGFQNADFAFVSVGKTYKDMPVDKDPHIIHVDTGFGKFDHHQFSERSSAALRVATHILETNKKLSEVERTVIERLAEVATMVDNFEECLLPNADSDFYDLGLHQLIRGYRIKNQNDHAVMEWALSGLDGYYYILANKVHAELDIAHGIPFHIGEVKALGLFCGNEEALVLAEKQGYELVVRKDPEAGIARIKLRPDSALSLRKLYDAIKEKDPHANWFLHKSERMLLNGSRKHAPENITTLSLQELIAIVKQSLV